MLKPDSRHDVVLLLDVDNTLLDNTLFDNTLLDNDRFQADLDARLLRDFGRQGRDRYWTCRREAR